MEILQLEKQYSQVTDIQSVMQLKQEVGFINKGLLSKLPEELKAFFISQLKLISQIMTLYINKYQSKELTWDKYALSLKQALQKQQNFLQEVTAKKNQAYQTRIQKRVENITKEIQFLQKEQVQGFAKVIEMAKQIIRSDPSKYSSSQSNMIDVIDKLLVTDKVTKLATRYKQYYNLAVYFRNNMPDKQSARISTIMQYLAKFKESVTELKKNPNFSIGQLLIEEAKEITVQEFHQMTQKQYLDRIKMYNQKFKDCMKKEMEFKKLTINAKKQGMINPSQQSMDRITKYNQDRSYLQEFPKNPYTFFPEIQYDKDEIRELILQNNDVEPFQLKIKFFRLVGAKSDKYQIHWNIKLNNDVISQKTDFTDSTCVFNYEHVLTTGNKKKPCYGLHENSIQIQLFSKGFFSNSSIGQATLPLTGIKDNCSYEGQLEIKHKSHTYKLEYGLYQREAEFPKKIPVESIKILRTFPPFDLNEGVKEYVQKHLQEIDPALIQQEQAQREKLKQENPQQYQQQQAQQQAQQQQTSTNYKLVYIWHTEKDEEFQNLKKNLNNLPQGLTQEDVINADDPVKNRSFQFIEAYIPIIEDFLQNNADRKEKKITRQLNDELLKQQIILPREIQEGDIDLEEYVEILNGIIKRDKLMAQFFQQINCTQRYQFVMARSHIVQQELAQSGQAQQQEDEQENNNQQQNINEDENIQTEDETFKSQVNTVPQQQKQINNSQNLYPQKQELQILPHSENNEQVQKLKKLTQQDIPNQLNMKDVIFPETPSSNRSLEFLKKMEPILDQGYKFYTQQGNQEEKDILRKIADENDLEIEKLEEQAQEGELDPEKYVQMLKDIVKKDELLIQLYMQLGIEQYASFCAARKQIVEKELKDNGF
ncbi:hypothetical protein PPERSA_01867 [Pseudocohnilembus persalinus]|uniref:Uncharacterized protein n=1 Tax=Pseudocohnilembus persalinus TaxID=266149 RepID=A0A0V0R277_PSEPJ|nr:hypothetical protein PPERSA_01867 [Pseudocohnilembus persalinus]|eukprot:KRX08614.1 hypothetical protein PPERSA_01867 [Pseudocohnilembus persalinus]